MRQGIGHRLRAEEEEEENVDDNRFTSRERKDISPQYLHGERSIATLGVLVFPNN